MGMVDYCPWSFSFSFLLKLYQVDKKFLTVTGCGLSINLQVIVDSTTGSIADFACEVEITEQVFDPFSPCTLASLCIIRLFLSEPYYLCTIFKIK